MPFSRRSFLFRRLLYFLLDTFSHAVENPTHQVKGILGGSVLFLANESQGITVEKIEWDFYPESGGLGFWLGEFSHGKLEHPSPTDRFGQRLDMVDEITLRVKDLELDDSGLYNARIWFSKAQFQEQSFSLTVYEPVPTPQIIQEDISKSSEGCNVTLRCQIAGRKEFNISWKIGVTPRALERNTDEYQPSDNGRELRVLLSFNPFNSTFTCLVSNPVDQNRASFDLSQICPSDDGGQSSAQWKAWLLTVGLIAVLLLMTLLVVIWRRRRRKLIVQRGPPEPLRVFSDVHVPLKIRPLHLS